MACIICGFAYFFFTEINLSTKEVFIKVISIAWLAASATQYKFSIPGKNPVIGKDRKGKYLDYSSILL
jgi:hypothetical protein